jgi:hypothetical protein
VSDRSHVEGLAQQMQEVTGSTVELAHVDKGYTGDNAVAAAGQRKRVGVGRFYV